MKLAVFGIFKKAPRWGKVVFIAAILVVVAQFAYPSDRALPFVRLDGQSKSFAIRSSIEQSLINDYDDVKVITHVHGKTATVSAGEAGLQPDIPKIVSGLTEYPWYFRLIPFSIVLKGAITDQKVVTVASGDGFKIYAKDRVAECAVQPKNASLQIQGDIVVLSPSKDGAACTEDSLRAQMLAQNLSKKKAVELDITTTAVTPSRVDKDVEGLVGEANEIIDHKLAITVAEKVISVEKAQIASWLVFNENAETKKLAVSIDDEKVKTYLGSIEKAVYIAPGVTVVSTYDGKETSRVPGGQGRGVNLETTAAKIHTQILQADAHVVADLTSLAPTVRYVRSYSGTPEGVQALVNDLVQGKNMAISVRRLGDAGANANGDKQYHPASTYKLFVAYAVLKRIDAGSMGWNDAATNGQTVSQCFDNMIVNSDNACAEWFGGTKIHWAAVEADARAMGASRTSFTKTATFLSTANDLALFLQKLESNQLGLTEASRGRLLEAMKRQRFRQGIPSGVSGTPVADKVGFLDGKLHDAGIVYTPSGVYVLAVMSDGGSWADIASVANQVNTQLSRIGTSSQ